MQAHSFWSDSGATAAAALGLARTETEMIEGARHKSLFRISRLTTAARLRSYFSQPTTPQTPPMGQMFL